MLNNSLEREDRLQPFFFFLFPSGFSCFFFCERRNKRNETKNTAAKDTKKNPLLGEVSRLHRDGEGYTFTDTREPHPNRLPAFSLTPQAQRKSLAKRNAAKAFRRCDGEEATPPPPARAFEKARPKLLITTAVNLTTI